MPVPALRTRNLPSAPEEDVDWRLPIESWDREYRRFRFNTTRVQRKYAKFIKKQPSSSGLAILMSFHSKNWILCLPFWINTNSVFFNKNVERNIYHEFFTYTDFRRYIFCLKGLILCCILNKRRKEAKYRNQKKESFCGPRN